MGRWQWISIVLIIAIFFPEKTAVAQRGELIESLFRTIAEAQLEREQRKRLEAEQAAAERAAATPLPNRPGSGPPRPADRNPPQLPVRPGDELPPVLNVGSREVAAFAQTLVSFHGGIDVLVQEIRSGANANSSLRKLLPDVFQVQAGVRSLITQCNGLAVLGPLSEPYANLEVRWRELAFGLRAIDGLSGRCLRTIAECEKQIVTMSTQLGIQPQFDRHDLHDALIVTATYQQVLLDDLSLSGLAATQVSSFSREVRLLRQRILIEADHVEQESYEEMVARLSSYSSDWHELADRIYRLPDPHLAARLDRISELSDRMFRILWMQPPLDFRHLTVAVARLQESLDQLYQQLTIRSLADLPRAKRLEVYDISGRLNQSCAALSDAAGNSRSREAFQSTLESFRNDWSKLRTTIAPLPAVDRGFLTAIDNECDHLSNAVGLPAVASPQTIDLAELAQTAAALESAAEYFEADVFRYQRWFQSDRFRQSMIKSAEQFTREATAMHDEAAGDGRLTVLRQQAGRLIDDWQQVSDAMSQIQVQGLTEARADFLRRSHQEMAPLVAKIATLLLEP